MNALDNIIKQIKLNAEAEIAKLQTENEQQCSKIVENYNKLIEIEKNNLNRKIETFKNELKLKVDSENFIFRNKAVLETKQKLILTIKEKTIETLCTSKEYEEQYFNFMERLIEDRLTDVDCVLFYGRLDYSRFLEHLKFKSSSSLKIEQSEKFDYGALISCSDFEINLCVNQLVSDYVFKLKLEILEILNQGE